MVLKINLASTLAALLLFFVPWVDIQCSGKTILTQTGIQTAFGGASASKEIDSLAPRERLSQQRTEKAGPSSVLVLVALLLVSAAFVSALLSLRATTPSESKAGLLCGAALVCILAQMAIGFPVEKALFEEATKEDMAAAMALGFQVRYQPWIYLEILALAVATLTFLNGVIDRAKASPLSPPPLPPPQ